MRVAEVRWRDTEGRENVERFGGDVDPFDGEEDGVMHFSGERVWMDIRLTGPPDDPATIPVHDVPRLVADSVFTLMLSVRNVYAVSVRYVDYGGDEGGGA